MSRLGIVVVALASLLLGAARAAGALRLSGAGELLVGGGYDSNLFLQVAASPDSPNYHPYRGAFWRAAPALTGGLGDDAFRLELRYAADLLQTAGNGRLYLQDAALALVLPELGPLGLRVAATGGRFDAGDFPSDGFWSWGAMTQLTARWLDDFRFAALYEIDRRRFDDPGTILVKDDLSQLGQLRVGYLPAPALEIGVNAEYLWLRSDAADPTQAAARLQRWRAGVGASTTPRPSLTLLASGFVGTQSSGGSAGDRQLGGAAAVLLRAGRSLDILARYEILVDRARVAGTDYARQVATLGVVGHLEAGRRPPPVSLPGADQAPQVQDGGRVLFRLRAPAATQVSVIGSWNDWATDAAAQKMRRTRDPELWEISVPIGAGVHRYRFVVDGRAVRPLDAPRYRADDFGGEDGVIEVALTGGAGRP